MTYQSHRGRTIFENEDYPMNGSVWQRTRWHALNGIDWDGSGTPHARSDEYYSSMYLGCFPTMIVTFIVLLSIGVVPRDGTDRSFALLMGLTLLISIPIGFLLGRLIFYFRVLKPENNHLKTLKGNK